jgi:sec-independent protein translocase protein TatC
LTPPDVISQLSLAIPAYFLYEFSILAVVFVERKRATKDEPAGSDVTPSSS